MQKNRQYRHLVQYRHLGQWRLFLQFLWCLLVVERMGNFCLSSKRKPMRGQVGLAVPKTVFWTPSFNYNQKEYIQYKQYTYIRWMTFPFVSALPFPFLHVVNGSLGNQSVQVQRMYHQVNLHHAMASKCCDVPRGQSPLIKMVWRQNVVTDDEVNLHHPIFQWTQNVVRTIHICFKLYIHICFTTRSIFIIQMLWRLLRNWYASHLF